MNILYAMLGGFALDWLFGDPAWLTHPVVIMGKAISALERALRARLPKTPRGERLGGLTLAIVLPVGTLLLTGGAFIMILSYTIRRMPYTIRSSSAILRNISPSIEEASINLGASDFKTFFKVTVPMMMSGVISGAILSWIMIITELSTSIILYTSKTKTMTLEIYSQIIRGNDGVASAISAILTFSTIIALAVFFKVSGKKEITM